MTGMNATYATEVLSQFSVSRLYKYLNCPESYRLHYLERWRPKVQSAGMVFGAALHVVLADFFRSGIEPVKNFLTLWEGLRDVTLSYNTRESWEELKERGENLLALFVTEEAPKIVNVSAIEKSFEFQVSDLAMPFTGIIDLVANINGKRTVIDFKTSASRYEPYESILSDQLTAYFLAEPEAKQVAFCVFVKTKKPKIEWFFAERDGENLVEFLAKVSHVISEVEQSQFYKRPGRQCGICDFLPICLRNAKEVDETLIKIEPYREVSHDDLREL